MLLVGLVGLVGLAALAGKLGLEVIAGAFIAGAITSRSEAVSADELRLM